MGAPVSCAPQRRASWSSVALLGVVALSIDPVTHAQVVGSEVEAIARVGGGGDTLTQAATEKTRVAQAHALLARVFQDHAVLQRDQPIAVWGEAAGGEVITVSLANSSEHGQADPSGHWRVTLPPMSAGGPFVLTAQTRSGVRQSVSDILLGDAFLCSGQSNMELQVERAGDSWGEIANSSNDTIRMLTVAHASSPTPGIDFSDQVTWQSASPKTVPQWSAVCFYFARELQKSIHVPIGLVHSSWGGTNIRPWISAAGLKALGGYDRALETLALYATDAGTAQRQFAQDWEVWWRGQSGDRIGAEPWSVRESKGAKSRQEVAATGHEGVRSEQQGTTASQHGDWLPAPPGLGDWRNWGVAELRDFTGLIWYRTHITLTPAQAKSAVRLDLGPINQVDATWINGKPLGNTFGYGTERSYAIASGVLHAGDNVLVVNVFSTYGGGGLLAGGRPRAVQLSDGDSIPLQGPWQYRIVPSSIGYPPRAPWDPVGGVATLYNAMVAPLGSFGLRGVLWYQGESNTSEAQSYQRLLTALMADWRRRFGPDLPFLVVQLPNYGHPQTVPEEDSDWAALREAQRAAVASDPHAGLAVTIDIGEPGNLHPTNKQDVGRRLARAARHVIYGEPIEPSGPVASSATRVGNQIAVEFADTEGGLTAHGYDHPIGFELCGDAAQTCRFTQATIAGTRVVLPVAENASPPTRVRYCWAESPTCTLFDRSGLPAGPFQLSVRAGEVVPAPPPQPDSASFDPDGVAHITRVVPEPMTISPEARKWLDSLPSSQYGEQTLAQRRASTDEWRARDSAEALKQYPVTIQESKIAGVPVDLIRPLQMLATNRRRVLINLHGGGFNSDSGSRIEGDPIANLTRMEVVSVYYRLAPENPFPAAVDDVVAVYKELLKTYKPASIGIFGTSAGGALTCEVAVRLKQLRLPLPGALGILSASGDFSRASDTRQLFTLDGLPGTLRPTDPANLPNEAYVGKTDRRDPVLSPLFADLHGMPPTLFISGTRDALLGDTSNLQRAMLRAGVDARLVVFDALPHAFWYHFEFPETHEALRLLAQFLDEKVAH